jgi:orotidine-5'-phosphate decarboxylase
MTRKELIENIKSRKSFLCVGLDTDIKKLPECVKGEENPIFAFNKAIIDATAPYAAAYKPNAAFYECQGMEGWEALKLTCKYIKENYPDKFVIADAKRGDIGNTSKMYARAFFEDMDVDAVTVAPYMGEDSVTPFLEYKDKGKWVILLALTSNGGSRDFQMVEDAGGDPLYKRVLKVSKQWADEESMMYVVGATKAEMLGGIREIVPDSFLLVPGVGAQGGSLEEVCRYGFTPDCGLLVNSSRGIIYASSGDDFAQAAAREAKKLQEQMAKCF